MCNFDHIFKMWESPFIERGSPWRKILHIAPLSNPPRLPCAQPRGSAVAAPPQHWRAGAEPETQMIQDGAAGPGEQNVVCSSHTGPGVCSTVTAKHCGQLGRQCFSLPLLHSCSPRVEPAGGWGRAETEERTQPWHMLCSCNQVLRAAGRLAEDHCLSRRVLLKGQPT